MFSDGLWDNGIISGAVRWYSFVVLGRPVFPGGIAWWEREVGNGIWVLCCSGRVLVDLDMDWD